MLNLQKPAGEQHVYPKHILKEKNKSLNSPWLFDPSPMFSLQVKKKSLGQSLYLMEVAEWTLMGYDLLTSKVRYNTTPRS